MEQKTIRQLKVEKEEYINNHYYINASGLVARLPQNLEERENLHKEMEEFFKDNQETLNGFINKF
jgi:hypothetical protein